MLSIFRPDLVGFIRRKEIRKQPQRLSGFLSPSGSNLQCYSWSCTLTCSDDFTYINAAEKKRRKAKKADLKKKSKTALPIDEPSAMSGNDLHDKEGSLELPYLFDEFNDVLPSNLEEHMYWILKEEKP